MNQKKEEMPNNKSNFSYALYGLFYSIRKRVLLISYIFCVICIGSLTIILLHEARVPPRIEFLIGFLIAIAGTIGGLLFSVLLDLPEIGCKFDKIKNDIASGKIKTPEEFASRVSDFVCEHFKFIFLNVEYAFIQIVGSNCYCSNNVIFDKIAEQELDSIILKSQQTENVFYINAYSIYKSNYHLYVIPIWFGQDWLGCIGIFNSCKLLKMFTLFLSSFENECIDDQLVHVLNIRKAAIQKQVCRELDLYSDKISRGEYNNLNEYGNDLLELLITKTHCTGALFATIYDEQCIIKLEDDSVAEAQIRDYYKKYFQKYNAVSEIHAVSDLNDTFKYVFVIPINIIRLRGIICLFNDSVHFFNYFKKMLVDIGNIKIDNDLENLSKCLKLTPKVNAFLKPNPSNPEKCIKLLPGT